MTWIVWVFSIFALCNSEGAVIRELGQGIPGVNSLTCCWLAQWKAHQTAALGRSRVHTFLVQSSCPVNGGELQYGQFLPDAAQLPSLDQKNKRKIFFLMYYILGHIINLNKYITVKVHPLTITINNSILKLN